VPIDPKTGKVDPFRRRAFKGCQRLCKGFKGSMKQGRGKKLAKKPPFPRCVSICLSVAQKGTKRGFTRIPKKGAKSCKTKCPDAGVSCIRKCTKARLRVPKTRDRF